MTTYNLTVTPQNVSMVLGGGTAVYVSPWGGSGQTVDRGGLKWKAVYSFLALRGRERADMMALVGAMQSQSNRLRVPVFDNPRLGAYGGTPLVDGAAQTGFALNIKGCSINVTEWIAPGDYFSVIVNGEPELKQCTAAANSNGTGLATINFVPRLRASPADNAVIYVEDKVLTKPTGVFLFESAENGWSSTPGNDSKLSTMTLSLVEDVFATQA
jgi:hypothetical protein